MNKPKLSPLAKRVLKAVQSLLQHYQRKPMRPLSQCPLCRIPGLQCDECPWETLEGIWCVKKAAQIHPTVRMSGISLDILRNHPTPKWRAYSIRRLTRWARLIKNGAYDRKLKEAKS